jgi:micrococcal nuclease
MRYIFSIAALFLLLAADAYASRTEVGMVRNVYDGDTILMATSRQSRLKVRLYGIDAPETGRPEQEYARVARRTLMYKIMGREVTAEIIESDKHQRAVAIIRFQGRDINREMVSEGMAWAYRQYLKGPYASQYIDAEERARSRHKGLWRKSNPQPPWEFRKSHGESGKRRSRH